MDWNLTHTHTKEQERKLYKNGTGKKIFGHSKLHNVKLRTFLWSQGDKNDLRKCL